MKKLVFIAVLWMMGLVSGFADNVRFTTDAPDAVVNGEQFRLTFSINTSDARDFRAPSIANFDVLMGPSRSQQSSTQIINGNMTSSSSVAYTYVLAATKVGTFTIPGATIKVNGKEYKSNAVRIQVLPPDKAGAASSGSRSGGGRASSSQAISGRDLFMTATLSKAQVREQEAVLLTYKIYTVLNLTELQGDMPDLKGFHSQEIPLPRNKQFSLEHYNGRNYRTVVWRQFVLFPQQSGRLEIPSVTFNGVVAQETQTSNDPFDAFFNGGSNYVEVRKKIVAPKASINVLPLPSNKPASFSGAVGEFSLTSSINSTKVKTGDAVTLKLILSGTGNMKLVGTPSVKFPADFETYDPKVDNKFSLNRSGLSGNKVFEYLAIPRNPGKFTIPATEFTFYDLRSNSYKTLKTQEYTIEVEKGKGDASQVLSDFTNKEDVKVLGKDILYIKLGKTTLHPKGDFFFGTIGYYLWYIIPLILFIVLVIAGRKQALENANVAKVRTKKANKIATQRMKVAGSLMQQNKKEEFYDEVLKALWGYISDKLNIPVSQLSKDNIEAELTQYGISEELIKEFIDNLNRCEFARYAPAGDDYAMDKVYSSAIAVISKIEDSIKH